MRALDKEELLYWLDFYLSRRGLTYDDSINDLINALTEEIQES